MKEFNEVKQTNGPEKVFSTGSVRDSNIGKGRYDLIPTIAFRRLAKHYENGAKRYGDRNWEEGQNLAQYYNSLFRHLLSWKEGLQDEDHLAAILWNAIGVMHHENEIESGRLPVELADAGPLCNNALSQNGIKE